MTVEPHLQPGREGMNESLTPEEPRLLHAYWRAANYLSVGQIYLFNNPLLKQPLGEEHIKPRLLYPCGTTTFMAVDDLDRYYLMSGVINRVSSLSPGDGPREALGARRVLRSAAQPLRPGRRHDGGAQLRKGAVDSRGTSTEGDTV